MYRRKITISQKHLPEKGIRNFPFLVSVSDPKLKHISAGGHVRGWEGEDIYFVSADAKTRYYHEIETYQAKIGQLRAWISLPSLMEGKDTIIYLYYGDQEHSRAKAAGGPWDSHYRLVLHCSSAKAYTFDSSSYKNHVESQNNEAFWIVRHSKSLTFGKAITVETFIRHNGNAQDIFQTLVSKWSLLPTLNTFEAYDAGETSGMSTKGYFGAVFDGRYIYFAPQSDGSESHGRVLRFDTRGNFKDSASWVAYEAGCTSGLNTKGYYGGVFDGRYIYFVPRYDGYEHHSRILRYDTLGDFGDSRSWSAYDAGLLNSYQSAAFDGRYIYFVPGYEGNTNERPNLPPNQVAKGPSGKVLRYDTLNDFHDKKSYALYDAGQTSGLISKGYDGAVFDGRYVYFIPLESIGIILRYDTQSEFASPESWLAFDFNAHANLKMDKCVGGIYDGRYVYFVPYAGSTIVRYDSRNAFTDPANWEARELHCISRLVLKGYDGAVFDGRYIYFVPFWEGEDLRRGFHGKVLRYDTCASFQDDTNWKAFDARITDGLILGGFNGAAFDGRYIYFAPWREGSNPDSKVLAHGKVLRYDTTGELSSFSLRFSECGHNGGLCASFLGPAFLLSTSEGVLRVQAKRLMKEGLHQIAGVFNGYSVKLFVDGSLVSETKGSGIIQKNNADLAIGAFIEGSANFAGTVLEARISDIPRSPEWITTGWNNYASPQDCCIVGEEERVGPTRGKLSL